VVEVIVGVMVAVGVAVKVRIAVGVDFEIVAEVEVAVGVDVSVMVGVSEGGAWVGVEVGGCSRVVGLEVGGKISGYASMRGVAVGVAGSGGEIGDQSTVGRAVGVASRSLAATPEAGI
jgi:hypothetical protein